MAENNQTVTILLEQFNHMCDMLDELREYKKNSTNMLEKIRVEIENLTYYSWEVSPRTVIDDVLAIIDMYKAESEE